jgi:2'-5' RNA ligase
VSKRLFVAVDLPESTRELLSNLDPCIRGVRWVDAEQIHLTLGFFADVPEEINLAFREKLSGIEFGAFFLPIIGVGAFPARGWLKVIWIGVGRGHPHLFQLHKRVSVALFAATDAELARVDRTRGRQRTRIEMKRINADHSRIKIDIRFEKLSH